MSLETDKLKKFVFVKLNVIAKFNESLSNIATTRAPGCTLSIDATRKTSSGDQDRCSYYSPGSGSYHSGNLKRPTFPIDKTRC